jgi:hypothetical protein
MSWRDQKVSFPVVHTQVIIYDAQGYFLNAKYSLLFRNWWILRLPILMYSERFLVKIHLCIDGFYHNICELKRLIKLYDVLQKNFLATICTSILLAYSLCATVDKKHLIFTHLVLQKVQVITTLHVKAAVYFVKHSCPLWYRHIYMRGRWKEELVKWLSLLPVISKIILESLYAYSSLVGFPLLFLHKYKIFPIVVYMYALFFNKVWNFHIIDFSERVATVQKVLGKFFWATIIVFKWMQVYCTLLIFYDYFFL